MKHFILRRAETLRLSLIIYLDEAMPIARQRVTYYPEHSEGYLS